MDKALMAAAGAHSDVAPQKQHFCGAGLGLEPDPAGRACRAPHGHPEGVLLPIPQLPDVERDLSQDHLQIPPLLIPGRGS